MNDFVHTHVYIIDIYNHRKQSLKGYLEMLHKDAVSFILKKRGTGSVTVTVCGFRMEPTRGKTATGKSSVT